MPVTIQLSEPTSREAVTASPAKEFAQAYILDLVVDAKSASGNDYITVKYCPFNQASGERLLDDERSVTVPFWQVMESVPEAALAFKAVGDALPTIIAYKIKVEADIIAAEKAAEEAAEEARATEEAAAAEVRAEEEAVRAAEEAIAEAARAEVRAAEEAARVSAEALIVEEPIIEEAPI